MITMTRGLFVVVAIVVAFLVATLVMADPSSVFSPEPTTKPILTEPA